MGSRGEGGGRDGGGGGGGACKPGRCDLGTCGLGYLVSYLGRCDLGRCDEVADHLWRLGGLWRLGLLSLFFVRLCWRHVGRGGEDGGRGIMHAMHTEDGGAVDTGGEAGAIPFLIPTACLLCLLLLPLLPLLLALVILPMLPILCMKARAAAEVACGAERVAIGG